MPTRPLVAPDLPQHYFVASELDKKAEPIEIPLLVYPDVALLQRIKGKVILRIYINHAGMIDDADILAAEPPNIFERAALDAVLPMRFRPALRSGRPVKSVKVIEVRFDPREEPN